MGEAGQVEKGSYALKTVTVVAKMTFPLNALLWVFSSCFYSYISIIGPITCSVTDQAWHSEVPWCGHLSRRGRCVSLCRRNC